MSLQPGPQDPSDESALTPSAPPPDHAPAVEAPAHYGPDGTDAAWSATPPPGAPAPADWAAPPAPAEFPTAAPSAGAPAGIPPMGGASGYGPTPPVVGWASPPPPAPGYPYAPPPPSAPGSYDGPPQGYPPSGYPPVGYQAVGYPTARQTDSKAVVALILAISSWVICPFLTAVVALVLAGQSNRAIDASGGQLEGRSMNTATKVIAWINIVLSLLALVGVVIALVFFAAADPSVISDLTDESTQF